MEILDLMQLFDLHIGDGKIEFAELSELGKVREV
jgi:hypothetical protein